MINFAARFRIKWTQDCQGKEDFDGDLVSISTRIYSRGGSAHVWGPEGFTDKDSPSRQHIRPMGYAILTVFGVEHKRTFEADTTEQLKQDIVAWYSQFVERAMDAVREIPI